MIWLAVVWFCMQLSFTILVYISQLTLEWIPYYCLYLTGDVSSGGLMGAVGSCSTSRPSNRWWFPATARSWSSCKCSFFTWEQRHRWYLEGCRWNSRWWSQCVQNLYVYPPSFLCYTFITYFFFHGLIFLMLAKYVNIILFLELVFAWEAHGRFVEF